MGATGAKILNITSGTRGFYLSDHDLVVELAHARRVARVGEDAAQPAVPMLLIQGKPADNTKYLGKYS